MMPHRSIGMAAVRLCADCLEIMQIRIANPVEILSRILYNIRDRAKEENRMKTGYSKQIQERINGADVGTIFMNSDFADIADSETIRRNLNRLTKIGMLRRILKGVYEKPKYSKLLDEYRFLPNTVFVPNASLPENCYSSRNGVFFTYVLQNGKVSALQDALESH